MSNQINNSNSNSIETILPGGIQRLTIGSVAAPVGPTAPYEATKVRGGVTRYQFGAEAAATTSGTTKHLAGQDQPTGSVMATLQRHANGDSVELIPGIPGSRTAIKTALADGLIEAVGNGHYRDRVTGAPVGSDGAPKVTPEAPKDAPIDPGLGVFDATEDALWAEDIKDLDQSAYDSAAALVTIAVMRGEDNLDKAAMRLSESAGIEPALAAEYVSEGYAMYERVVSNEITAAGVTDKAAFYGWLQQSRGRALEQAVQSLTAYRDVGPFRTLAAEWNRHN